MCVVLPLATCTSSTPTTCPAIIRKDGKVLSVAGAQDTIFDTETGDGKNVVASNALIYAPDNYAPLKLRLAGTEALWAR